jgi:selenide,water dikinase
LFDPQTSGGLLIAVAPERADALANALVADGLLAARIGRVEDGNGVIVESKAP